MVKPDFEMYFHCKIALPWELFFLICIWDDVWSMAKIKHLTLIHVYLIQALGVSPSDWVISNVTCCPLTFLDIIAFKMRGDTNIDGNMSGIIIFWPFQAVKNILTPCRSYWLVIKNDQVIANVTRGHRKFYYYFSLQNSWWHEYGW